MDQYHYQTVRNSSPESSEPETVCESNPSKSHSSSSFTNSTSISTDFESEYTDITSILMATKTEDPSASTSTPIVEDSSSDDEHKASHTELVPPMPPPAHDHSTKPSSASWFTFDDIPHHKWPARLQEFAAWIDLQGTKPSAQSRAVLREFMARSTGSLRDWLESLGEYRQLQFMQSPVGTTLNIIHEQLIGEKTASTDADRKEYHQMKCCYLKRHLLESHYKRMSILFYKLNGFNEPSLKHVFIASLPSELQPDLQRKLTATNLSIADISLGKIFQMAMLCLDKIYEQKEFFKDLMASTKPFSEACKKPYLKMECKDEKKPSLKMSILPCKFHKPVPVIGFIDTGADTSMIDPSVLPSDYWEPHSKLFRAVNGETFETTLITKKPIDFLLAKQECSQLLQQGLIEPTDSDWACQAFYVEKQSELVRGKKRLVIDYQPLNSFLKDDKFPLPKIQTLFVHLHGARIFSKFDLKAGFWQLGISPVDRHKTTFCIPDAHYQWTVLPFGLKVAPSLFQKAMTKFFSPILHHALVYIDDILLFSSDHESHQKLLLDFFHIMQAHGIMLSEKKSSISKESIDFLGMVIKDGHYQPGQHIAIELLKFPDTNFTKKQIQQFLGIVNYVRDFIPKVAIHTSQLSRMPKKTVPSMGSNTDRSCQATKGGGTGVDCVWVKSVGRVCSASILANSALSFLISASFLLNSGTSLFSINSYPIPVGSCTWRCYTRSIIERSLSLGPVARKFWFPADIHLSIKYQIQKSYLKTVFHDITRTHRTHGLKEGERCEDKNRFWRIKQDLSDA
ncbi:hypothetical protein KPL70_017319 [Citrus sinensis]|nr:hypothetical protein KPL70_017319 [Citrus sinensis]